MAGISSDHDYTKCEVFILRNERDARTSRGGYFLLFTDYKFFFYKFVKKYPKQN